MKKTLILTPIAFLATSCGPLKFYTKKHVTQEVMKAHSIGFQKGQAAAAMRYQQMEEAKARLPQPAPEYYEMTTPAHVNPQGILISQHPSIFNFSQK